MAVVEFTQALSRFFPTLKKTDVNGSSVREILLELEHKYPGFRNYVVDDQGILRQHVNIFVGDTLIQDKKTLSDVVSPGDKIFIFQALSGG